MGHTLVGNGPAFAGIWTLPIDRRVRNYRLSEKPMDFMPVGPNARYAVAWKLCDTRESEL